MKDLLVCLVFIISLFCLADCKTSLLKNKEQEKAKLAATDSIEVAFEMITNAIEAPVEMNFLHDGQQSKLFMDNSGKI